MKIILSRKGFDSSRGGYPSPILPDGTMISLPIDDDNDKKLYSDLKLKNGKSYLRLMEELGMKGFNKESACHLDPDINRSVIIRKQNWNGAFGQINAAQGHLRNCDVKEDDLFLFFGWFKRTKERDDGTYCFDGKDMQVLWGYLQIKEVLTNDELHNCSYEWLKEHPHFVNPIRRKNQTNTIYLASKTLSFNSNLPGFGILKFKNSLILTKEGHTRSKWNLDNCFKEKKISYHSTKSWKDGYFQSAMIGQEFVIEVDPKRDEKIMDWVKEKLS